MNSFPVESVVKLREIFASIRAGTTTILDHVVDIAYCTLTLVKWWQQAGTVAVFESDPDYLEFLTQVPLFAEEMGFEVPQAAPGGDPVEANGLLLGMILKMLMEMMKDPEFWQKLIDLLKPKP